jgi:Undecaprenyl-phosphate galactose phosphotransferase WbaP
MTDSQTSRTSLPLVAVDCAAVTLAVLVASSIGDWWGASLATSRVSLIAVLGTHVLLFLAFAGLYPAVAMSPVVELRRIAIATSLAFACYATSVLGLGRAMTHLGPVVLAWPLTFFALVGGRSLARSLLGRSSWWGFQTLVAGSEPVAKYVYETLDYNRSQGLRAIRLQDDPEAALEWARESEGVHTAIVAGSGASLSDQASAIREFNRRFTRVILLAPEAIEIGGSLWMKPVHSGLIPGLEFRNHLLSRWNRLLKRAFDLLVVTLAAPTLLLLWLVIGAVVKVTSPGPILYGSERIGEGARRFRAWKFRTMASNADLLLKEYLDRDPRVKEEWERTKKLRHDPRITKVGRLLRRTSLDELPQIWNVFRGEMSVVGPRPILPDEVEKYGASFDLYAEVRPGITGLWQVSGRNNTPYSERVRLCRFYVRNWSPWLDVYIVLQTVRAVLTGDGAR